jgi:hypothetical protein
MHYATSNFGWTRTHDLPKAVSVTIMPRRQGIQVAGYKHMFHYYKAFSRAIGRRNFLIRALGEAVVTTSHDSQVVVFEDGDVAIRLRTFHLLLAN